MSSRNQLREQAKMALRRVLYRRNLDLVRAPYPVRVAAALAWLRLDTVLDVGANVGQYGTALRAAGYRGAIISCEPLSDAHAQLARRSARDPRWTALHTAVGAEAGTLEINVSANSYSSSALPMMQAHLDAAPDSRMIGVEQAPVTTVERLLAEHAVDPAGALLKVDTQGYEAPVLDGAGGALAKFAAIALELSFVPLYAGQALFDDLVARLRGLGFELYGLDAGIADPRTGRILQCDGMFVRADLVPGREA